MRYCEGSAPGTLRKKTRYSLATAATSAAEPLSPRMRGSNALAKASARSGVSRSGSMVMKTGWIFAATGPSFSSAAARAVQAISRQRAEIECERVEDRRLGILGIALGKRAHRRGIGRGALAPRGSLVGGEERPQSGDIGALARARLGRGGGGERRARCGDIGIAGQAV